MKSNIVVALAMLFVSVVRAGVVTVSDPGQAPSKLITVMDIVPFVKISLVASNASGEVFLTVNQRSNSYSQLDVDLFAGSMSNKFTGGPTVIGPFAVQPGQTNDIVVSARVNGIKATNSSPTIGLDLTATAVSNSTPGVTIQGVLPIQGTTYLVDTNSEEIIRGKITSIKVLLNYKGAPLDTNGVHLDILFVKVEANPLRLYQMQYSEDMVSWHPISQLFGGLNDMIRPWSNGTFYAAVFMRLPPRCYYRLESFLAP